MDGCTNLAFTKTAVQIGAILHPNFKLEMMQKVTSMSYGTCLSPWKIKEKKYATQEEKKQLFQQIQTHANRLANDYLGLMNNESTNQCENKFSIRQSLLPKRSSSTRAGAFHTSVALSTLRLSLGADYIEPLYRECTQQDPSQHIQEAVTKIKRRALYCKSSQEKQKTKRRRRELKQRSTGVRKKSKLRGHADEPDLPKEEVVEAIAERQDELKANLRCATEINKKKSQVLVDDVRCEYGTEAANELSHIIGIGEKTKTHVHTNQKTYCCPR